MDLVGLLGHEALHSLAVVVAQYRRHCGEVSCRGVWSAAACARRFGGDGQISIVISQQAGSCDLTGSRWCYSLLGWPVLMQRPSRAGDRQR
jgi:hypothetical protein